DRPALAPAPLDEHLVRCELVRAAPEPAIRQLLELAGRERFPHRAELLAELGPQLRQVRLHLQLDRLDRAELDVLDAQLVGDFLEMTVEARPFDDEPAQRLPQ